MAASASGVRAGRAYVELSTDNSKLTRGLNQAEQQMKSFGRGINAIGQAIQLAFGAALVKTITDSVSKSLDQLSKLADASANLGIEAGALQGLQFSGKLAGVSDDQMGAALAKMLKTVGEAGAGSKQAAEALDRLGLSAKELRALAPDQQFAKIGDALKQMPNAADRVTAAQDIFGKSGVRLIGMLTEGSAGLAKTNAEFAKLGGTLSELDIAAADLAGDSFTKVGAAFDNFKNSLTISAAPAMIMFANSLTATAEAAGIAAKGQYTLSRAYLAAQKAAGDGIQGAGEALDSGLATLNEWEASLQDVFGSSERAERARREARRLRAGVDGPTKASDILQADFDKILAEIEANAAKAKELRGLGAAAAGMPDELTKGKSGFGKMLSDAFGGAIRGVGSASLGLQNLVGGSAIDSALNRFMSALPFIGDKLSGAAEQAKTGSAGTFSGSMVAQQLGGNPIEKQQLAVQKEMAGHMRQVADASRHGGISFT
jgi:hypothetical protein